MDKHSKIKLMRKRKKLFPWLRTFSGKYSEKFFNTDKAEVFEYLFLNVDEEMKNIYSEMNKEKAEDFFSILNSFFLHFWWQIRWKSCRKWNVFWKKVKSSALPTDDCHRKCCVHLLYSMILLAIFLTGGDEISDWIGRILTAMKSLPDAVDIVCSALLLINDLKKKHKPIYNIILKHVICSETVENTSEPQTYCKVILLFRRLLMLSKDKLERSQVLLFSSKLKVPCNFSDWLSSQNIEVSEDLDYNKDLTKELLSRSYPDEFLRKLSEILIEQSFCKGKFLIVDCVDAYYVNIQESNSGESNSEPNRDLLHSSIETNMQEDLNSIKISTSCEIENKLNDINNIIKDKDLHDKTSHEKAELSNEINVSLCAVKLKKKSKKRKLENEKSERDSSKKKKKDKILLEFSKNHKKKKNDLKKSKKKPDKTDADMNEELELGTLNVDEFKISENDLVKDIKTFHKISKSHKQKADLGLNKETETSPLNLATSVVQESDVSKEALNVKGKTLCKLPDCSIKAKKKKSKPKHTEKKKKHSKKSKKHSKEKLPTKNKETAEIANQDTILKPNNFPESENGDEYKKINEKLEICSPSDVITSNIKEPCLIEYNEQETSKKQVDFKFKDKADLGGLNKKIGTCSPTRLATVVIQESHLPKEALDAKEKTLCKLPDCSIKSKSKKSKSKNKEKKKKHSKKSKKHSKEKLSTKNKETAYIANQDTIFIPNNFSESENRDEYKKINKKFEICSQSDVITSNIKEPCVFEYPSNNEQEISKKQADFKFKDKAAEADLKGLNKEIGTCSSTSLATSVVQESHLPKEALDAKENILSKLPDCNIKSKSKKSKSKHKEKKKKHSKKSKKHSKEKLSTKNKEIVDIINPDTILMLDNFPESENPDLHEKINEKLETCSESNVVTSNIKELCVLDYPSKNEVETFTKQSDSKLKKKAKRSKSKESEQKQNHLKKSKKRTKEKLIKCMKATKTNSPGAILQTENFSESESHELQTENNHQRKKRKKHSKEKHKNSSKRMKTADCDNPDAILPVKNFPESEKLCNTKNNQFDEAFNESDGIKSDKKKENNKLKIPAAKNSSNFFSENNYKEPLLIKETVTKESKIKKKKLFNNDLYYSAKFQIETAAVPDVSISDILKTKKVDLFRNNAALGIEDNCTSNIKTRQLSPSKDFKIASTKNSTVPNKDTGCDSEQERELFVLKNELLIASKKILEQSYISESYNSPSLFDKESGAEETENDDNQSAKTFHSESIKESVVNSGFVIKNNIPNEHDSTDVMLTEYKTDMQQSQLAINNEDTFSSMDYLSKQNFKKSVNIRSSSEYSFDSSSHSSRAPTVVLKDVLQCKSTQHLSASEKSFISISESDNFVQSCDSSLTVTNLEMSASQELTLENIVKVNELYEKNENSVIDNFFTNKNYNLPCPQNILTAPVEDYLNLHSELNELQSSTSPSLLQTADNRILLNEFQTELLADSVGQPVFNTSVLKSQTNESETLNSYIENETVNHKSVGTTTEIVNSSDFSVNCNISDRSDFNSNKISSLQMIVNFTGNPNSSASNKQQFVANFDFHATNNSTSTPVTSSVFLNPVSSSLNNIHYANPNVTPIYQPLHVLSFNKVTSSIDKNVPCAATNDNDLVHNLFSSFNSTLVSTSSPTIENNSFNKTEYPSQLSLTNEKEIFLNNSLNQDNFLSKTEAILPQDTSLKHLTAENLETLNEESIECSLEAEVSNNNSSYRTSTIYSDASDNDDGSVSTVTNFSDIQTELSIGETLEIGASNKSSSCRRNKFQVSPEPESFINTESPVIQEFGLVKKENSKPQKCSREPVISPVTHRYNLRIRKAHQTPKISDE